MRDKIQRELEEREWLQKKIKRKEKEKYRERGNMKFMQDV